MNVATNGPEGYEYQYHVSLKLILRFWEIVVKAVVDTDGEDATLSVEIDGRGIEIELQAKSLKVK